MKTCTKKSGGFSPEERAAIKACAQELKVATDRAYGEKTALAAIAKMPKPDRSLARRLHALITIQALSPKAWYGMHAYAKDDAVVCFFQNASKFKVRYATLGFSDKAKLDNGPYGQPPSR